MPKPKEWYNHPNTKEIIYPLFDTDLTEKRIRVRFITRTKPNGKKEVETFSVGLEMNLSEGWTDIVRYCNYHSESELEFHTHNKYFLACLGDAEKIIMKLSKKKTPASQMRWAIKDIVNNYAFFRKEFNRRNEQI